MTASGAQLRSGCRSLVVVVVVVVGSATPSGLPLPTQSAYSLVSNFRKMMIFVVISDTFLLLLGEQLSQNDDFCCYFRHILYFTW